MYNLLETYVTFSLTYSTIYLFISLSIYLSRRALYGVLPFFATFGMHHREEKLRRVLSSASVSALHKVESEEEFQQAHEHLEAMNSVDPDEVSL